MWRLLNELKIPFITLLDYDLGRFGGGQTRLKNIAQKLNISENANLLELEQHNVFFSYPLDFDMLMINAFPNFYNDNGQDDTHENLVISVLGKNGNEQEYQLPNHFFSDDVLKKYRYLFKTKSKVASHYLICDKIKEMKDSDFKEKCPDVLCRLVKKASEMIKTDDVHN